MDHQTRVWVPNLKKLLWKKDPLNQWFNGGIRTQQCWSAKISIDCQVLVMNNFLKFWSWSWRWVWLTFQAPVHCSISAVNESKQRQEKNSWECRESNLGLLGAKQVRYPFVLCSPLHRCPRDKQFLLNKLKDLFGFLRIFFHLKVLSFLFWL